ncbi:MAG: hypothetical protein E6J41_30060 [Chloroflexi bacterium]|nr:MAG: hypothetical protein E6J41_30060 [Chloroflexota bacterium]
MSDRGWRLRAARAERGLTEDALAMEVRRWADLHGTSRPEITAATIAEWEAGGRPIDGAALRLLWLALVAPNRRWADPDVAVWSLFRPAGRRPDHAARRREFLDYAASLGQPVALDPDRLDAMLDEAIRVDSRAVEGLAFVASQLRKRLGTEPPHATRRLAHAHLEAILGLLDHTIAGDLRHHLEAAAATTAVFAGIVSIYVCRLEPAAVYLELGQRLAREAGDVETEAIGLLAASRLHSHISPVGPTGDPARAQELLEAADRRLGRRTAPAANAWVLLREAEELAGHDERAALRLADEADRLTLGAGSIPADGLCCRWSIDLHVAYRGNVNVLAGRPARGIPLLEAALAALPSEAVASRPLATADLGGAYAMQGEVDHACALLREALAMAMAAGLPEAVTRVRAARELRLAAHGEVPAVRDLDEELRAAAALAP